LWISSGAGRFIGWLNITASITVLKTTI
jgi:hypothetical protein